MRIMGPLATDRGTQKESNGPLLATFFAVYAIEGEDMINRIITGDESWVHYYEPESKRVSIQ